MAKNFIKGLKKAAHAVTNKKNKPPAVDDYSGCNKNNDDNLTNKTADYGIILVKHWKKVFNKDEDGPDHRGRCVEETIHINKEEPEHSIVDRFAALFCGACVSDTYCGDDTISNNTEEDSDTKSRNDPQPTGIAAHMLLKEQEQDQAIHNTSVLTDVSMLTDGSPLDLQMNTSKDDMMAEEIMSTDSTHRPPPSPPPTFRKKRGRNTHHQHTCSCNPNGPRDAILHEFAATPLNGDPKDRNSMTRESPATQALKQTQKFAKKMSGELKGILKKKKKRSFEKPNQRRLV